MSPGELRGYVRAGLLSPERGDRGELRFTFQDLVFLRSARGLTEARLPPRRIRRALTALRERLPEGSPLAAVRLGAEGSRIVVEDGTGRWQPESGQILLDFGEAEGSVPRRPASAGAFPAVREAEPEFSAEEWFELGCELEGQLPGGGHRRLPARDRARAVARGRARQSGPPPARGRRRGGCGGALRGGARGAGGRRDRRVQPRRRPGGSAQAARGAAGLSEGRAPGPANADAHFNAAALAERLGRTAEALQHLQAYRKLTRS